MRFASNEIRKQISKRVSAIRNLFLNQSEKLLNFNGCISVNNQSDLFRFNPNFNPNKSERSCQSKLSRAIYMTLNTIEMQPLIFHSLGIRNQIFNSQGERKCIRYYI